MTQKNGKNRRHIVQDTDLICEPIHIVHFPYVRQNRQLLTALLLEQNVYPQRPAATIEQVLNPVQRAGRKADGPFQRPDLRTDELRPAMHAPFLLGVAAVRIPAKTVKEDRQRIGHGLPPPDEPGVADLHTREKLLEPPPVETAQVTGRRIDGPAARAPRPPDPRRLRDRCFRRD